MTTCKVMWKETGSLTDLRAVDSYYKLRSSNVVVDIDAGELKPTKVTFQTKISSREKKLYIAVVFLFLVCVGLFTATLVLASRRKAEETSGNVCWTQECLFVATGK